MTAIRSASDLSFFRAAATLGQHILTLVGDAARNAADRGRFAALPRRYLDDAGMTPSDFADFDSIDPRGATATLAHSF